MALVSANYELAFLKQGLQSTISTLCLQKRPELSGTLLRNFAFPIRPPVFAFNPFPLIVIPISFSFDSVVGHSPDGDILLK